MNVLRHFLLFASLVVLFLPASQHLFELFPLKRLGLFERPAHEPSLNTESWFDGSFAGEAEHYISRNIGFRNRLVVSLNRIDYKIFGQGSGDPSAGMTLGKENWIFQVGHIERYADPTLVSVEDLPKLAGDLSEIQQRLDERGIAFFFVLSPSKVQTMEAYLPDYAIKQRARFTGETQRERLLREFDAVGIRVLDCHASFEEMLERGEKNLFPRDGFHWSFYGCYRFSQEVLKRIQPFVQKQMKIPEEGVFDYRPADNSDVDQRDRVEMRMGEDIAPFEILPYPTPTPDPLPIEERPNVLFVGTSFSKTLVDTFNVMRATGKLDLLYYSHSHYDVPPVDDPRYSMVEGVATYEYKQADIDWEKILSGKDIVILETYEYSLKHAGWGFQDSLLKYLRKQNKKR